jgi:heme iron utilization protein
MQPVQETSKIPPPAFTGDDMRRLLRRAKTCCLSTLAAIDQGPYGSVASLATDVAGRPIILISKLALHTQNLMADGRASVLVSELPSSGDPLTGPRVTVMGKFAPDDDENLKRRYLARHPAASFYAGFGDFSFWRMTPDSIHGVAGFGRISTLTPEEVFPDSAEMEELEPSAIAHMNEDHARAVQDYAEKLLHAGSGQWKIAAIDGDGCDLVWEEKSLHLPFATRVTTADHLRATFAGLLKAI